jgi:spore coat protein H
LEDPPELMRPDNWTRASHCKGETPDYDRLFDDTLVQRFDITIAPADHQAQMDELTQLFPMGPPTPGETPEPSYVPVTVGYGGQT